MLEEENKLNQEKLVNLIIGSLLHDVGKVIYRTGDGRKHSVSGADFLKNEAKSAVCCSMEFQNSVFQNL